MSHRYLHSAITAGAAARDRRLAIENAFAQILKEPPAILVGYAARLCAHAGEQTERADLSYYAIALNELARQGLRPPPAVPPATVTPAKA